MRYLRALKDPALCEPSTYVELIRTPAMQTIVGPSEREARQQDMRRRVGAKRTLVAPTKPEPVRTAPVVQTQAQIDRAAALEQYRRQLFDEVWSLPTQKVATQHGVSDVAIAKTCKRLKIPKLSHDRGN